MGAIERCGHAGRRGHLGLHGAGTPGSSYCGDACTGTSTLSLPNFYATPGSNNTVSSLSVLSLQPLFQAALDQWSAVANVQFQYVGIAIRWRPASTRRPPRR